MDDEFKKNQTIAVLKTLKQNIEICKDSAESLDDDYEIKTVKNSLSKALKSVDEELEKLNA